MGQYTNNLANNILSEMGRMNWTQTVAADFCMIHKNELQRILYKKADVRLSTLEKISMGLQIPISQLIGEIK